LYKYIIKMNITSFEDYEQILRSPYVNNPIDINIGFYGLCSYQPDAWDYVFGSIRRYYPNEPIVLINDGMDQFDYSEMAHKYNCIYVKKDREICLHYPDIESSYEFLKRTLEACNLSRTEWLIHLHPDVICQGRICYQPNAHLAGVSCGSVTGISNNNWKVFSNVENYIRKFEPNIELNGWGWCGGSIMNVDAFRVVYNSIFGENPKFTLEEIRDNTHSNITEHEDTMMSVLFALNGFVYRIWKDNPEFHRNERAGAFLHGYKEHYDFKKKGLTCTEYFTKCRTQNINKRKKEGLLNDDTNYLSSNVDDKYLE